MATMGTYPMAPGQMATGPMAMAPMTTPQMAMVPMATDSNAPNNIKCLSCIPYKVAVLIIASLTMVASICDIFYGALGSIVIYCYYDVYYNSYQCFSYYAWFAWTSISQGSVEFIMSILLFVGILKRVSGLLITFMVVQIINGIGYIGNGAVMLTQWHWYGDPVYYGVYAILWGMFTLYFITVIASYRRWMIQQPPSGTSPGIPYYLPQGTSQGVTMQPLSPTNLPMVSTAPQQIVYPNGTQHGTYLPPGAYLQQGTYVPQGVYQPQEQYFQQRANMTAGVNTEHGTGNSPVTSLQRQEDSTSQLSVITKQKAMVDTVD